MIFTAYNKECRINLGNIFGDQYGIRAEYKEGDTWKYIAEPSFYSSSLNTKEKTDEFYQKALLEINEAMAKMFGKVPAPESGKDRINWLIENKTIVVNDNLKLDT